MAVETFRGRPERLFTQQKFGLDPMTGQLQPLENGLVMTAAGFVKPMAVFRFDAARNMFVKVKRRKMNPLNFKALKRASSRMDAFQKTVLREFKCEERGKKLTPKKRRVVRKR